MCICATVITLEHMAFLVWFFFFFDNTRTDFKCGWTLAFYPQCLSVLFPTYLWSTKEFSDIWIIADDNFGEVRWIFLFFEFTISHTYESSLPQTHKAPFLLLSSLSYSLITFPSKLMYLCVFPFLTAESTYACGVDHSNIYLL